MGSEMCIRDSYLYIPLGGSRGGKWMTIRNTFLIFLISGFWHGANWTFVAWGGLHACFFLPYILLKKNRKHLDTVAANKWLPNAKELFQMLFTFLITCLAWVFFRAENIAHAFDYLGVLFSSSFFSYPEILPQFLFKFLGFFLFVEWIQRTKEHALDLENLPFPRIFRWGFYYLILIAIIWYGGDQQEFIYFQF